MRLLVAGGAGFIGSNFCRVRRREHGDELYVLDKLTYAGRREILHDVVVDHVDVAERGGAGVFHAAGGGRCSWHELTVEAYRLAGLATRVAKTTSAEFVRPAPRPAFSVLATEREDGVRLPAWQDGVKGHLSDS